MLRGEEEGPRRSQEGQGMPGRGRGRGSPPPMGTCEEQAPRSPEGTPWVPTAHFYQGISRDLPQEGMPLLMKADLGSLLPSMPPLRAAGNSPLPGKNCRTLGGFSSAWEFGTLSSFYHNFFTLCTTSPHCAADIFGEGWRSQGEDGVSWRPLHLLQAQSPSPHISPDSGCRSSP